MDNPRNEKSMGDEPLDEIARALETQRDAMDRWLRAQDRDRARIEKRLMAIENILTQLASAYLEDRHVVRTRGGEALGLIISLLRRVEYLAGVFVLMAERLMAGIGLLKIPVAFLRRLTNPMGVTVSHDRTERTTGELLKGREVLQRFTSEEDGLQAVFLKVGTFGRANSCRLVMSLLNDQGEEVRRVAVQASTLEDNRVTSFSFPPLWGSAGKVYTLRLMSPDGAKGNAVTLWYRCADATGKVLIDGKTKKGDLFYNMRHAARRRLKTGQADLLIVTPDRVGPVRMGIGMRHWSLAKALASRGLRVSLASTQWVGQDVEGEGFAVHAVEDGEALMRLAKKHRAILVQGDVLPRYRTLEQSDLHIIVDLVTPIHIEDLAKDESLYPQSLAKIELGLRRGDFFICGNERQRLYWLGHLAALGRIGKDSYEADPELRDLIDVVGFGIEDQPPKGSKGLLKGSDEIGDGDFLLTWFGGLWDWLDPLTVIKGVVLAHRQNERVKLWFPSYRSLSGQVTKMAQDALKLSESLGALGRCIIFHEMPIAYEGRGAYLAECDAGVVCQASNLETQLSARTRVLDYLWAGLPTLINSGDAWAEVIEREGLGLVVDDSTEERWAEAVLYLANNEEAVADMRENVAKARLNYRWTQVVRPLEKHLLAI